MVVLIVHTKGNEGTIALHVSTIQQLVFICGICLALSCQNQDDLSLYYNTHHATMDNVVSVMVESAARRELSFCVKESNDDSLLPYQYFTFNF